MTTAPPPITVEAIHNAIDEACRSRGKKWERAPDAVAQDEAVAPLFRIVSSNNTADAEATFYIAYSTWDGRFLYLDNIKSSSEATTLQVYQILAEIAIKLHCSRFTWQHFKEHTVKFRGSVQPETLGDWLTLYWERDDAAKFLADSGSKIPSQGNRNDESSASGNIRQTIETSLQNEIPHDNFKLRLAGVDDVDAIGRLVQGLADFEKEPDAVNVTLDQYRNDGFGSGNPLFYCLLLEYCGENDCESYTCGMAFCYLGHKLETGSFFYLEDLFIEEAYRGKGAGSFIMKSLAVTALSLGCDRLVWQALDWNTPALTFYNKLGAKVVDGLLTTRFAGQALTDFNKENTQHSTIMTPPLTVEAVHGAMDEACRGLAANQWKRAPDAADATITPVFRLVKADGDTDEAATFYVAYSTWDGRYLYVDDIKTVKESTTVLVYRILAEIAVLLHCCRLTWRHLEEEADKFPGPAQPETLDGVVTLYWERDDAAKFIEDNGLEIPSSEEAHTDGLASNLRQTIEVSLQSQDPHKSFKLRLANIDDLVAIGRLVQGLADCAKEPEAVNVTPDQYCIDGFGKERPLFYCFVLDHCDKDEKKRYTCGMAFCYIGHKSGSGSFLYLEDLFIEEAYRGKGAGTFIMKSLAATALSLDCSRLVWQALNWNTPGLRFYNRLGAKVVDGLLTTRFAGRALKDFNSESEKEVLL